MIRGISIASIPVRNQDAASKFYTEKLGFKVLTDQPFTGNPAAVVVLDEAPPNDWSPGTLLG